MKKVNLFLIGSPKCGTSSVCKYLETLGSVYSPKVKEPNYFSRNVVMKRINNNIERLNIIDKKSQLGNVTHAAVVTNLETYNALYDLDNRDEKYLLDASTYYCLSKEILTEVHNYNNKAKFILCVRKPSDRIRSHYLMDKHIGTDVDIHNAIKEEVYAQETDITSKTACYLTFSDYEKIVENLKSTGIDVHIVVFENLISKSSQQDEINKLRAFLGEEKEEVTLLSKDNATKKPRFEKLNNLKTLKLFVQKAMPSSMKKWLASLLYQDVSDSEIIELKNKIKNIDEISALDDKYNKFLDSLKVENHAFDRK